MYHLFRQRSNHDTRDIDLRCLFLSLIIYFKTIQVMEDQCISVFWILLAVSVMDSDYKIFRENA